MSDSRWSHICLRVGVRRRGQGQNHHFQLMNERNKKKHWGRTRLQAQCESRTSLVLCMKASFQPLIRTEDYSPSHLQSASIWMVINAERTLRNLIADLQTLPDHALYLYATHDVLVYAARGRLQGRGSENRANRGENNNKTNSAAG